MNEHGVHPAIASRVDRRPHYVYVAQLVGRWAPRSDGFRVFKIGLSSDLRSRMAGLAHAMPCDVIGVAQLAGDRRRAAEVERTLHQAFQRYRVSGEWFAVPTPDEDWAEQVLTHVLFDGHRQPWAMHCTCPLEFVDIV